MDRKTIYILPETHFSMYWLKAKPTTEDVFKLIKGRMKKEWRVLTKREKIIDKILKKYQPKVIFHEGVENKEIEKMYKERRIIFLDEGCKCYHRYFREILKLWNELQPIYDKLFTILGKVVKKEISVSSKTLSNLLRISEMVDNLRKSEMTRLHREYGKLLTYPRELYWVKKRIIPNFEKPSLLVCGLFHISSFKTLIKGLIKDIPYDYHRVLNLLFLYPTENKKACYRLIDILRHYGFTTKIVGYLPSYSD